MFKWTTVVLAGLACCLTLPALNAGTDMGCLPPPLTQDYLKKTVRVEIKGKLEHVRIWLEGDDVRDPTFRAPMPPFFDSWQITVGGKTYTLDLGPRVEYRKDEVRSLIALPPWMDPYWQAGQLAGKTVIVTGTLDGETVHVTSLKADEDSVKQTTEVEARGQLGAIYLEMIRRQVPLRLDLYPQVIAWNFTVDGKTYTLSFATPELENLARTLDGKAVVLTGEMNDTTITVKTLKAAQ